MTTLAAPAKLTRTLRVTGVRDDGYHLIDAEMVSLDLADELTFADGDRLTLDGPEAVGLSVGADNLVAKALQACGRTASVHVHKDIPAGGGLGGGGNDRALDGGAHGSLDVAARLIQVEGARLRVGREAGESAEECTRYCTLLGTCARRGERGANAHRRRRRIGSNAGRFGNGRGDGAVSSLGRCGRPLLVCGPLRTRLRQLGL